ncbi:hypothetical protein [Methanobacterium sp.]|uniref:hypothetical protein n=1 Tax=Methanobacterium sp. TaxID=2164 RepID=UPI002AB83AF7|nr:hypothetical protein [Methanobacterium sp.]MDY9922747.1 hypothetical protein [Methanobacterium sp.]
MFGSFRVDTVSRVQAVLASGEPQNQIIKIREVTDESDCPKRIESLPEFPDQEVRNGTRVYQKFRDGRIFEICVLRR